MFKSLQSKLVVIFVGLFLLVQALTLVSAYTIAKKNIIGLIQSELFIGERVFHQLLQQRFRQLATSASILATDFAFRQAIATEDYPRVLSVIQNHGAIIRADRVALISLEGKIIADTMQPSLREQFFAYPELLEQAQQKTGLSLIITEQQQAYQTVIVPILAPLPIAWVQLSFVIDDQWAMTLKELCGLEVSLLDKEQVLFASTLSAKQQAYLQQILSQQDLPYNSSTILNLQDQPYVSLIAQGNNLQTSGILAVLQTSLIETTEPYRFLFYLLLLISAVGFLIVLLGSRWLARDITLPIQQLVLVASKVAHGEYQAITQIQQQDELGELTLAFNQMIHDLEQRENKVIYQAEHDPLTGLPNRLAFGKHMTDLIAINSNFAVALLKVNQFSQINNTLGHNIGDQLIREIGQQLQEYIGSNMMVAQLGDDQFILSLLQLEQYDIELQAKNILVQLSNPIIIENVVVDVDCSIGIALYPEHGETAEILLQKADIALHLAKANNQKIYFYDASQDNTNLLHLSLMSDLRQGMEHGDLELYYQPKVNVKSKQVTHVEALIRWNHKDTGFMPAGDFIPLAEQTGYVSKLTDWILKTAIQQHKIWLQQGVDITIAINLSAKDLLDKELPWRVMSYLQQAQVKASALVLEITESSIMQDVTQSMEVLSELHGMGIEVSIDDFGTGYSSMAYLKKLPVKELKIDKSFVLDMTDNKEDANIVDSIIGLGHSMGIKVIAEGVENEKTFRHLEQLGCDMVQGYYIARPLPLEKFNLWLEKSVWKKP